MQMLGETLTGEVVHWGEGERLGRGTSVDGRGFVANMCDSNSHATSDPHLHDVTAAEPYSHCPPCSCHSVMQPRATMQLHWSPFSASTAAAAMQVSLITVVGRPLCQAIWRLWMPC